MDPVQPVPRKHRWFQIHLSTALVLMFVAGSFGYANLIPARKYADAIEMVMVFPNISFVRMNPGDAAAGRQYVQAEEFGFPLVCWKRGCRVSVHYGHWEREPEASIKQLLNEINEIEHVRNPNHSYGFDRGDILTWSIPDPNWPMMAGTDLLVVLGALSLKTMACEHLIRRREARRP